LAETGRSKKNKKKNKRRKAKAKEAPENVNQNHDDKVYPCSHYYLEYLL